MNRTVRNTLLFIATMLLGSMAASGFAAEGNFDKTHPRRAEVNKRLNNQDRRIHHEVKEGEMPKGEARKLHKEDHHIRKEERRMAAKDGGHISKKDQRRLNRQENKVSQQIGK